MLAGPWSPEGAGGASGKGGSGALAIIQIVADIGADLDEALSAIGLPHLAVGRVMLRRVLDIDEALVARFDERTVCITPHGGALIVRLMGDALERRGLPRADPDRADPRDVYPEAADLDEACMLDALAHAASPLAIEALLRQPPLWRSHRLSPRASPEVIDAHARVMNRLLTPPTVAAAGPPSVGKSTLVNALARRAVSLVAEAPGTTRDHVGVTLDLAGLVVRWIDTPGLTPRMIEAAGAKGRRHEACDEALGIEAASAALAVIRAADLVVLCGDDEAGWFDPQRLPLPALVVRCRTRADRGPVAPDAPGTVITAAARELGLHELARAVRAALVPDEAIRSDVPWRFHPRLGP